MGTNVLIRKVVMDCPICNRNHEVEERERKTKTIIKDKEVEFKERFFFCDNAKEDECEFVKGSMLNENLLNARNAYREKYSLLTSNEIIEIRENYGLTQVDLARLLGWGEATIARYESKAIQDEAYDNMLRLIKEDPLCALLFLDKNEEKFSAEKKIEIREKILEKMDLYGKEYLTRQTFKGEYVGYEDESDYNGFTKLDIDKIEAAISYIAKKVPNLYKVKLMKMLWYSDAISFKNYGHAITGMVYRHNTMGALPVGHYSLMNLENLNVDEEESANYDSKFHIYPTENMDYDVLSDEDILVLDKVIEKFANYKAKDIVKYMHEEKAYTETEDGDIIPFSLAKEIRKF